MNKIVNIIITLVIIGGGVGIYFYETQAQIAALDFKIQNIGDGSSLRLEWFNPDTELDSIDVYQSTDEKNYGRVITTIDNITPKEFQTIVIDTLSPKKLVYFSLIGNKSNGKTLFLAQSGVSAKKFPNNIITTTLTKEKVPIIQIREKNGNLINEFTPFDLAYRGEIGLDRADFDGDGEDEIIAAMRSGRSVVRIFKQDGSLYSEIVPYEEGFTSGVSVQPVRFYNLDAQDNFLAIAPRWFSSSAKYGLHPIKIYRVDGTRKERFVLQDEFVAYDDFEGGVSLSAGDVNGDGHEELLTTTIGGAAEVRIHNLCTEDKPTCVDEYGEQQLSDTNLLNDQIFPYGRVEVQDIRAETYDLNNDGKEEIIIYPLGGRTSIVKVYECEVAEEYRCNPKLLDAKQIYNDNFKGGVDIAVAPKKFEGNAYIIVTPRAGGGPHLKMYKWDNGMQFDQELFVYNGKFDGGVRTQTYLFGSEDTYSVVTVPQSKGDPHVRVWDMQDLRLVSQFFTAAANITTPVKIK